MIGVLNSDGVSAETRCCGRSRLSVKLSARIRSNCVIQVITELRIVQSHAILQITVSRPTVPILLPTSSVSAIFNETS